MSYSIKTTQRFKKELKQLSKKYKKIKIDYQNLLDSLENNPTLGTPLGNDCYKIRIPNSSVPTGKSGGFRIITLVKIIDNKIILLTIYSKSDKENINYLNDILVVYPIGDLHLGMFSWDKETGEDYDLILKIEKRNQGDLSR